MDKKILYLDGKNLEADKKKIEETIGTNPIYIYTDTSENSELYQYIDALHDDYGLGDRILNRFRICKEIEFHNHVTLIDSSYEDRPARMSIMLSNIFGDKQYQLVIENNDRVLLANILQQLIYIDFPITSINIMLRSEYKDRAKTELFMKYIDVLEKNTKKAIEALKGLTYDPNAGNKEELAKTRAESIAAYERIHEKISKAKDIEMKLAIAASKKTGKSVIANCMLGMELIPTSLLLATPNTCVYKKSPDSLFHLKYRDIKEDFDTAEQIKHRIRDEFKKAQDDEKNAFTIPDMEIEYVSNNNNFETYSIYDTPGPDLAKASGHKEAAKNAINLCDVAIFAIDYSKFLTDSEEEYLKMVKDVFTKKQKFHTLIFVINKIDLALDGNNDTKSRIKSIDFIRSRLKKINKEYGDCVIFATSSQDYFNVVELYRAQAEYPDITKLLDTETDLYTCTREVISNIGDTGNDKLNTVLSNIDSEVGKLKNQLGYRKVTIETLKQFSGIPQLMSHVSYIAKSKARGEIVNSITFDIDTQVKALQSIVNNIENIKRLMNKTQEEIEKISNIIDNYIKEAENILSEYLTGEDLKIIEKNDELSAILKKYSSTYVKSSFNIEDLLKMQIDEISFGEKDEIRRKIWEQYKYKQTEKIKKNSSEIINLSQLGLSETEQRKLLKGYINATLEKDQKDLQKFIEHFRDGLISVINSRMSRLTECTVKCKGALEKEDCLLLLPELPTFDVSLPNAPTYEIEKILSQVNVKVNLDRIVKSLNPVHQFLRNLFKNGNFSTQEGKVKNLSQAEIKDIISGGYEVFCDCIDKSGLWQAYDDSVRELKKNVKSSLHHVWSSFGASNKSFKTSITDFKSKIDDRDHYKEQMTDYEKLKNLISQIQHNVSDFSKTWDMILTGSEEIK